MIGSDGQEVGTEVWRRRREGGQRIRERMTRPGCVTFGIARVT